MTFNPDFIGARVTFRTAIVAAVTVAVLVGSPRRALAQIAAPRRPSNGLLFVDLPDRDITQRMDITFSSSAGYDTDLGDSREEGAFLGNGLGPTGPSTTVGAAGDYSWSGRHAQFRASGMGSTLHYFDSGDDLAYSSTRGTNGAAAVGLSLNSRKTTFSINQTGSYYSAAVPYLSPQTDTVIPGQTPVGSSVAAVDNLHMRAYDTAASFTRSLTDRNGLVAAADYSRTEVFGGVSPTRDIDVISSRVQFTRRVGRRGLANAGYVLRVGNGYNILSAPGRMVTEHGVEVGVDQRRALSATRFLTFRASLGVSTMMLPVVIADGTVDSTSRRYGQFFGQVALDYDLGRTWKAGGTYHQGIEYVAGLTMPIAATGVTATVDGLFTRRVDLFASAGYSNGKSALNQSSSVFDMYNGTVRVRFAATHAWAPYVECVYYQYDSHGTVPLVPGIPPRMARRSVRTGLMLRAPRILR